MIGSSLASAIIKFITNFIGHPPTLPPVDKLSNQNKLTTKKSETKPKNAGTKTETTKTKQKNKQPNKIK